MAQLQDQEAAVASLNPRQVGVYANRMSIQACEADDDTMMDQAIALGSQPGSRFTAERMLTDGLKRAARRNALRVLQYLLDRGADVNTLDAVHLMPLESNDLPSFELLNLIASHGWEPNPNPNSHNTGAYHLLWFAVRSIDHVRWCLDHGARVNVPDPPASVQPNGITSHTHRPRPTILGAAASHGTVETFELLRAKGAPLDRRCLHRAVEHQRLDMVRHLVEAVGVDVDADGRDAFSMYHSCGTAICITAFRRGDRWGMRPLVLYLLRRGADPELAFGQGWPSAVECAKGSGNAEFLQVLDEWRNRKDDGAGTVAEQQT